MKENTHNTPIILVVKNRGIRKHMAELFGNNPVNHPDIEIFSITPDKTYEQICKDLVTNPVIIGHTIFVVREFPKGWSEIQFAEHINGNIFSQDHRGWQTSIPFFIKGNKDVQADVGLNLNETEFHLDSGTVFSFDVPGRTAYEVFFYPSTGPNPARST